MVSGNEIDVVDGWIKDAITRLDESLNEKINLDLNQAVIRELLGVDLKDRAEYFQGARDMLVKVIESRVKYSHPGYNVAWIDETNAANDEPAGEDGVLVFTKKCDQQAEEKLFAVQAGTGVKVTTEQVHKLLADWDEDFHEIASANSTSDEQSGEEVQQLKKYLGS